MMSGFKIILRFAWRNLWRNYRRTLIMLAAIIVGAWAMIFMTALMRGMVDDMVKDGIRALPGHVQIHHPAYRDDPTISNVMAPPSDKLLSAWTANRGRCVDDAGAGAGGDLLGDGTRAVSPWWGSTRIASEASASSPTI